MTTSPRKTLGWGRCASLAAIAFTLAGCPKSEERSKTEPPAAPDAATAAATATVGSDGGASDGAGGAQATGQAASYAGSYSLAPAQFYIPESKEYASVKQVKDDPTKHVGEGTLTLTVGADGRVSGSVESGPAAPAEIDGRLVDGEIRGNVRRKDPSDDGLTGTLVGKVSGDAVEGNVSLAVANAAIVRDGKLSLKKK